MPYPSYSNRNHAIPAIHARLGDGSVFAWA
jgi:hypothetical protein